MYFPYCAIKQYIFSIFHFYNLEIRWQWFFPIYIKTDSSSASDLYILPI